MIALEAVEQGVILPVRGQPGARRNALAGVHQGQLRVAVTQIAEKGKANKSIVAVLAKTLRLKKSQLTLLSGETSPQKKFLVTQIGESELRARIAAALDP